jgi:hypothetical protein
MKTRSTSKQNPIVFEKLIEMRSIEQNAVVSGVDSKQTLQVAGSGSRKPARLI